MRWKTIIILSCYGIAIGIGIVLGLINLDYNAYRLIIIAFSSLWIGVKIDKNRFWHGLLVGFIGDSVTFIIVFIFFSAFLSNNPSDIIIREEHFNYFLLICGPFYGSTMGMFIGFFSWITGDIKPYISNCVSQLKEKISSSPIRTISYLFVSLLSFIVSIYFFGVLFASCAGHPPFKTPKSNILIIILSVFLMWIFYRLAKFFLKASFNSRLKDNRKSKV